MSYFEITGHPFTDAGIYALEALIRKDYKDITPQDIKPYLEPIARLYESEPWRKCFQSIFTGDSVYTAPHHISEGKKKFPDDVAKQKEYALNESLKDVLNWWNELLESFSEAKDQGSCPICGRREGTIPVKKAHIPLIGTGKQLNFFSNMAESEFVCPVCLLAVQFMPLNLRYVKVRGQAKFLLFHSHSTQLMRIIAKENIKNIRLQMASNPTGVVNYNGGGKTAYSTQSSLFELLEEVSNTSEIVQIKNPSIVVYEFSNYNQNPPPLRIIHLPNNVFRFVVHANRTDPKSWQEVVNRGWIIDDKKKKKFPDYKKWAYNIAYEGLLNERSIMGLFYSDAEKKVFGSEELLDLYMKEVLQLDNVDTAKRVADALVKYSVDKEGIEKTIKKLRGISDFGAFRRFFLDVAEEERKKGVLSISYDDFVSVTSEPRQWKTMQDRILYSLYEALSKLNNNSGGEHADN